MTEFPTHALYAGRRCRIIGYLGNNVFRLLDAADNVRIVHRSRFIFL